MSGLITEADLAGDLQLDVAKVAELRRKHQWPHVRLGRFQIRYTADQVAAIVAMQTVRPNAATAPPAIGGQTARSRKRTA